MKQKLNSILLIDDDDAINFLHKKIIGYADCATDVKIALNGEEALDYLRSVEDGQHPSPDLILLDINMPKMNGWEFLEEYKQLPFAQKGKVVLLMLTTSINPDDMEKAAGNPSIREYLNKPLMTDKLQYVLTKYFPEYL